MNSRRRNVGGRCSVDIRQLLELIVLFMNYEYWINSEARQGACEISAMSLEIQA